MTSSKEDFTSGEYGGSRGEIRGIFQPICYILNSIVGSAANYKPFGARELGQKCNTGRRFGEGAAKLNQLVVSTTFQRMMKGV
jgi:hypothetical protein